MQPRDVERRLGLGDAVVLGMGSMLGTGVFVVWSPAAELAGRWLFLSLGLAALVAYCNATSMAQLAAVHPESGGAYVYGRVRLGRPWGVLAGALFVVGKTASCATAALAVGAYVWPDGATPVAVGCVALATLVNLAGVEKSARSTLVLVVVVLAVLALVSVAALVRGPAAGSHPSAGSPPVSVGGVLAAAALFFFAFAGYARVATLGGEVRDPARVIPRAILVSLGVVLVTYVVVGVALVTALGRSGLVSTTTPAAAAVGDAYGLEAVVRVGAAVAALAVLVPLLAGVSRTLYAMARHGDLPRSLGAVGARHVPHRAVVLVATAVTGLALTGGLRVVLALSAGCVLGYYAVANAAALHLRPGERRWPLLVPVLGIAGCVTLAAAVAAASDNL